MLKRSAFLTAFWSVSLFSIALCAADPWGEDVSLFLKTETPAALFLQQEPLRFDADLRGRKSLDWKLTDWNGKELRSGNLSAGAERLELAALPPGYYRLYAVADGQQLPRFRTFAVLAPLPPTGANPSPGYFGMGAHEPLLIHLDLELGGDNARRPSANRPELYRLESEIVRRIGAEMVRDQVSWRYFEPEKPGFAIDSNIAILMKARAEHQIGSLLMVGPDLPQWALAGNPGLPKDLVAVYRFFKSLAAAFPDSVRAIEFSNEQDGNVSEPAFDFAACTKAAMAGIHDGNPAVLRVIGGLASPRASEYDEVILMNDTGKYLDAYNRHTYNTFPNYDTDLASTHNLLKKYQLSHLPFWITESASHQTGAGGEISCAEKFRDETAEQELLGAEYTAKMLILLQNSGVDRDFPFVLYPYNEGTKAWGLLRRDLTAKPALGAYANLSRHLNGAKLLGELKCPENLRAFLYRNADGTQTVAVWVKSELDRVSEKYSVSWNGNLYEYRFELRNRGGTGSIRAVNIFGSPLSFTRDGETLTFPVSRMPVLISGLTKLRAAHPVNYPEKHGSIAAPDEDYSVVLRLKPDLGEFQVRGKESLVLSRESGLVCVEIANLSETRKTGCLVVTGGKVAELPERIDLEPMSTTTVSFRFFPARDKNGECILDVGGTFGGRKISHARVRIAGVYGESFYETPLFGTRDPHNWLPNSNGTTTISFDRKENAVKFHTVFTKNTGPYNMWIYPVYPFTLPEDNLRNAVAIKYEIKTDVKPPEKIVLAYMMLAHKNPAYSPQVMLAVERPGSEWREYTVMLNGAEIHPGDVKNFNLGYNTDQLEHNFWVRNVRVVRRK